MVETIAPVVYGRKARYFLAVGLHALAAGVAGATFGAGLALLGGALKAPWGPVGAITIACASVAYASRELLGVPLPLFDRKRQVPDWWRTFYAPPVAATLYGAGLGIGFLTFLRFGTYVVVSLIAVSSGDVRVGALLGATFGLARALTTMVSAGAVDEEEAAAVVTKLERVAAGRVPRTVNGLVLLAVAAIALATSCDAQPPSTSPTAGIVSTASPSALPEAAIRPEGYARPRVAGHLEDRRITESSGLVASRSYPEILWTHNDSDDGPYLYALGVHGAAIGRWMVAGADALDWEDIAIGPGPRTGRWYIYVGDIGDNETGRDHVVVYRVEEPDPFTGATTTRPAQALRLVYPDRPHDAEALLVHPVTGDLYIVTKDFSGLAIVFKAAAPLTRDNALVRLRRMDLDGALGGITAGDISPDGTRLALATYSGAFEFYLPEDSSSFDDIWIQEPRSIAIGGRAQGEAIAYGANGKSLFTTSEGRFSPLLRLVTRND